MPLAFLKGAAAKFQTARRKIAASESDHVKIATSMILVAALVGGAKVVGAVKEIALAARFGTGPELDAYALVFSLASWPSSVVTAALGAVLVPVLIQLGREAPEERDRFFREAMGFALVGGIVMAVAFAVLLHALVALGGVGLSPQAASAAAAMAAPLAAMIPAGILSALLATRLMSGRRYVNTFFEALPSLAVLVAVLALGGHAPVLVWSTVAGFVVMAVAMAVVQPGERREIMPRFSLSSPHWKAIGASFGLMLLSQGIFTLGGLVADQVLVSHLGPGSNATLGYANRLLMLVNGLGATAVARATLPIFSEARLRGAGEEAKLAQHWMKLLFGASLVAIAVGWLLAPWGVQILFQRGEFSAADTANVAEVFRYSLLQVPFYFSGIVIVQLVASRKDYSVFLTSNIVSVAVKIGSGLILMKLFGIKGLMISTALMYATSTAVLWWLSAKYRRNEQVGRV